MAASKNQRNIFRLDWSKATMIFPLCFILNCLDAQEVVSGKFGPDNQFRLSVMPALYNNLEFENVGAQLYKSSLGVGGEVVVSFGQSIWKGLGVNAGIGIGFVPYNFLFDLVTDTSSIIAGNPGRLGQQPNRGVEIILPIPLLIEKKFILSSVDELFLNIEAGIKWNIRMHSFDNSGGSYWAQTEDGEDVQYFQYRFTNVAEREFISYVFKAGLFDINKRGNSLSWNLVLQRSPSTMLRGTYQFNELGFESSGTNNLYNNYIGLEFIFGLSLDKSNQ